MAALFYGKTLEAIAEAVGAREAGLCPGDGIEDLHDAIGIAAQRLRARRRGAVLVELMPAEAAALLYAANNALSDPDFRRDHLPTAARRNAADRAAAALATVAAVGKGRRG